MEILKVEKYNTFICFSKSFTRGMYFGRPIMYITATEIGYNKVQATEYFFYWYYAENRTF